MLTRGKTRTAGLQIALVWDDDYFYFLLDGCLRGISWELGGDVMTERFERKRYEIVCSKEKRIYYKISLGSRIA